MRVAPEIARDFLGHPIRWLFSLYSNVTGAAMRLDLSGGLARSIEPQG
jgi:hypothetical protein